MEQSGIDPEAAPAVREELTLHFAIIEEVKEPETKPNSTTFYCHWEDHKEI